MNTDNSCSEVLLMNKSSFLQNSLMLAPLIGATGSITTALGLWLMFVVVISGFGLSMGVLRPRMHPATYLPTSVLLAATLTTCGELAAQVWSVQWHQHVGIYAGLIALQCVVLEHIGFFQKPRRERLRLIGLFGSLMVGMGLLRELIGNGSIATHLSWLAGMTQADWPGWVMTADGGLRLATLAPGGFILLGLLVAACQAWYSPTPSH
jgi:electron transport complex protein RnfE